MIISYTLDMNTKDQIIRNTEWKFDWPAFKKAAQRIQELERAAEKEEQSLDSPQPICKH